MIFGGEYVCMQLEMEPIVLGGNNSNNNTGSNGNPSQTASASNQGGNSGSTSYGGDHDGYAFEESAGLLMESLDSSGTDLSSSSAARAMMPQKARSSEDATTVRGSYSPAIRSSILGGQNHGRQRTSDRYEMVPVGDPDTR